MCVERLFVGLAVAAKYLSHLPHRLAADRRLHAYLGTDGRTVRNRADQSDRNPVIAVAVVAIEKVREQRSPIVLSPKAAVGDEQIEKSIVIVVHPNWPMAPSRIIHEAAFHDPGEGAIAVVMVELVLYESCDVRGASALSDEEIDISVVIIVSPGTTQGVSIDVD